MSIGKTNSIGGSYQKKTITPYNFVKNVLPDANYNALSEVEIDGVKINLPDGYKENATGSSEKMNGDTKTIVKRYYSADDTFTVNVITSNQGSISGLPHAQGGEVEKTISDVKGLYDEDKHHFTYVQNGKMVMLSGVDEADLKEILIK